MKPAPEPVIAKAAAGADANEDNTELVVTTNQPGENLPGWNSPFADVVDAWAPTTIRENNPTVAAVFPNATQGGAP